VSDFDVTEHRLIVVKPGDILVIRHSPELTQEAADAFKKASGVSRIVALPSDIDISAVRHPTSDGR
jgi:succinyl-CoA synthetase alpha subunit